MEINYSTEELGRDLIQAGPLGVGIGATCILAHRSRQTDETGGGACTNKDGTWNYTKIATNTLISIVALWGFTRWMKSTNGM